jgi:HEAT repeat protein
MRSFWQCDREGQCDRDVQREITQALIKVAQDEAVPFFLDVLERHGDGTVLKGALLFLGSKMHVEKAADKIFAMLDHSYDDVKEAALEACVALGGQSMAARFRDMAKSPDPLSRLMAVYALGKIEPEDNIKEIKEALEDEVPDIRKIALEAVAGLLGQNGEAMGLLVSKLSDESREVRLAVVEQIGRSAMPEGVEYLMQALDDPDDWVRIRAMEALGQRQAQEAIPKLMDLLVTSNKLLALKVVETLGAIGGNTAFRALLDLLGGEDHDLTAAAEEAIAKIQGEQGVDR